jgi:cation diffusion facilitator family transporter
MALPKSQSLLAAWVSLISNFLLTVLKILVGVFFRSTALIADGVHNGGDVIASIATLSSMRVASQPADKEHPYGHGKAEDIASGIIAIILIIAGLFLIYESFLALFQPAETVSLWALAAAFISLVWKYALYIYTHRVGKEKRSKSLLATAKDHLADVYASLAAVIGIGFGFIGDQFNLPFAVYGDPAAGIIVSLLILKVAIEMGVSTINVLMESSVNPEKQ